MANWDFPSNPNIGDIYSFGGKSWQWNGSGWQVRSMTDELVDEVKGYRDDTQALYDQFTETFLGSLSTDPAGAAVGAMYYNTTDDIIRQLTDTGWVNLGNGVLNGVSDPISTTGRIGDFYINTTTTTLYGPKTSSGWGTGVNISQEVLNVLAEDDGASKIGFVNDQTISFRLQSHVDILDFIPQQERNNIINGTSTFDSSDFIQAANDLAESSGRKLVGSRGRYYIAKPINFTSNIDLFETDIVFDSSVIGDNVAAVVVKGGPNSDVLEYAWVKKLELGKIENINHTSGNQWSHNSIGLDIINAQELRLNIREIKNCAIGARLTTNGTRGSVHNNIDLQFSNNNKIAIQLKPGSVSAWVNDNTISIRRAQINSEEGSNISGSRHLQLSPFDINNNTVGWPNNNRILACSFEGNGPEYHIEICGYNNTLFLGRYEASPAKILHTGHPTITTTGLTNIFGGYGLQTATFDVNGLAEPPLIIDASGNHFSARTTIAAGGDSNTSPQLRGYSVNDRQISNRNSTAWTWQIFSNGLEAKRRTDDFARVFIDFQNSRTYYGNGTVTSTNYIGLVGSLIGTNNSFVPTNNGAFNLGTSSLIWNQAYINSVHATSYYSGANKVVGARETGFTIPTGTPNKGAFDADTATVTQTAQRLLAIEQALRNHGLID